MQAIREVAPEWISNAKVSWKRAVRDSDDDEQLARYAIATGSMDYRDWGRRLRRARAKARLTVWTHREQVRKVATVLFREGVFVHHGNPDHNEFFRSHGEDGLNNAGKSSRTGEEKHEHYQ